MRAEALMYRSSLSRSKSMDSGIYVAAPENRGQARPAVQSLQPTQNFYAHRASGRIHNNVFIQGLQPGRHVITGSHRPTTRRRLSDNSDSFHGATPLVSENIAFVNVTSTCGLARFSGRTHTRLETRLAWVRIPSQLQTAILVSCRVRHQCVCVPFLG